MCSLRSRPAEFCLARRSAVSTLRTRRTTVHHPPALHTVSVVIPTRNRGSLIEETIRSLLAMSHRDFELIVVDQSTNERTREAVEAVAGSDPRVRVCRSMTVGSSAARNVGASESQGDVVAYTDDDCIVAPGWLNGILEEFVEPRVAAVFGRLLPFESGPRTGREVGFKAAMSMAPACWRHGSGRWAFAGWVRACSSGEVSRPCIWVTASSSTRGSGS